MAEVKDKVTGQMRSPAVAFLPYYLTFKGPLGNVALDDLDWPDGRPDGLGGQRVKDLGPKDQLISYPRRWVYGPRVKGIEAGLSLLIVEPRSFHWMHMALAKRLYRRFYRVMTCDAALLAAIPNGQYFVFGNTWVPDWADKDVTKTRMLSLIASKKRNLVGHKLRHMVVKQLSRRGVEADVMGGGYRPFEDKAEGLAPYRYSIVIENSAEPGYFTEKLIDAFLLRTVPIYWGAPDITEVFDAGGMIICTSEGEIMKAVATLSEADYAARHAAIDANQKTAIRYADMLKSAVRVIRATL
jgi:hypothetical protein